jgi:hypothetical protein
MVDLEAIRARNEERTRRLFSALARKTAIVVGDPKKSESVCDDIAALLAEVERLRIITGEASDAEWDRAFASATTAVELAELAERRDYFRRMRP